MQICLIITNKFSKIAQQIGEFLWIIFAFSLIWILTRNSYICLL